MALGANLAGKRTDSQVGASVVGRPVSGRTVTHREADAAQGEFYKLSKSNGGALGALREFSGRLVQGRGPAYNLMRKRRDQVGLAIAANEALTSVRERG